MTWGVGSWADAPWGAETEAPSSGSYTLTADNAAWQFAVQNATLRVARKLTASNAPWEFAAQNAGLTVARKIAADNAAWNFAAQDATLTYTPAGAYTLTAESAAWQFAVPDATLTYSGAAIRRRGAAKPLRKGYIIRGKKYWLTDDELAIMVALELETIKRSDIKVPTKGRIKPIPTATFEMVKAVAKKLDELASIGLDDDEDEEEELLLML